LAASPGSYADRRAQLTRALADALSVARPIAQADRAHARVAELLAALGERGPALAELQAAADRPAGHAEDYEALAFCAFTLGAHELARDFYQRVVDMAPRDGLAWYNLATSDRNLGSLEAAESACGKALSLDPKLVQAALLRSQVRTQSSDANNLEDLRHRLSWARGDTASEIFLNYALGKELDDLGEFDQAFRHFARGAQLRRETLHYDVADDVRKLARIRDTFDADRLSAAPAAESPVEHGFIIGLPRSGTTMIERVLTGHPDVTSNGETDNLLGALTEGAAEGRDVFDRIAGADPSIVAEAYRRRAEGGAVRRLVLEKLPLNYLYAGAIRLTLPRARMVLVTRGAADNAFAMFSTLFGAGYPFSYDLRELATYCVAYRDLATHWRTVLGSSLLAVRYEDFVESPSQLGAKVAAHLGIEWRDEMTKIEENRTASATASAAQVRRPIYKSAVGRWRDYASHLGPLLAALRENGIRPEDDGGIAG
jgi:tetratricopeptide (TPR) repeat protein